MTDPIYVHLAGFYPASLEIQNTITRFVTSTLKCDVAICNFERCGCYKHFADGSKKQKMGTIHCFGKNAEKVLQLLEHLVACGDEYRKMVGDGMGIWVIVSESRELIIEL